MIALSTKWFTIACIVIWVTVSINLDWIGLLIGKTYRSGLAVVPWLLLGNLFIGVYANVSIWYKLTDQTKYGTWITIIGMSFTVLLNILLIPVLGYLGCSITFALSSLLMVAACYYYGQRYYPVPYDLKSILIYLGVAGALIVLSSQFAFQNLLVSIIVHGMVLLLFLAFLIYREGLHTRFLKKTV